MLTDVSVSDIWQDDDANRYVGEMDWLATWSSYWLVGETSAPHKPSRFSKLFCHFNPRASFKSEQETSIASTVQYGTQEEGS